MWFLIAVLVFAGWYWYKYDRNGFGARQMNGMTHADIAKYYRIAFLQEDKHMQEVFEQNWGEAYGSEEWHRFEIRVLEYLVDKEDKQAKERLALFLIDGNQWQKGVEYLEQMANDGSISAMMTLAGFFGRSEEWGGKAHDPQKSVFWYTKAAKLGKADAWYMLHYAYLTGEGVERDREKAHQCLEEAIKLGHQGAKVSYARDRYRGLTSETNDPYKAIDLLKSVLLSDDRDAIGDAACELGLIYGGSAVFGNENPVIHEYENVEEALRYFHMAKRIDPDSLGAKYYRSLMINGGFCVDEAMERKWIAMENEILRL